LAGESRIVSLIDITDRMRAEERLANSEERLKILFESAPDAYYLSDLKGKFIDGNKAAENLLGYKRDELVGMNFTQLNLLQLKDLPRAAKNLAKNALGKNTGPEEFILNRKDGSPVPVEIRTHPVKIKDKTVVLGIARNTTERMQAKETLQKSEEKFSKAFHCNPAITGISDLETGEYIDVNQTFYDKLGFTSEEVIGKKSSDVVHMDKKFRDRIISKMKNQGYIKNEDVIIYDKSGKPMNMLFFAEIIELAGKKYNYAIAIDITDHKRAESALRKSEGRLKAITDNIMDTIIQSDRLGNITYINHILSARLSRMHFPLFSNRARQALTNLKDPGLMVKAGFTVSAFFQYSRVMKL